MYPLKTSPTFMSWDYKVQPQVTAKHPQHPGILPLLSVFVLTSWPWFPGRCRITCKTPRVNASFNFALWVLHSPYLRHSPDHIVRNRNIRHHGNSRMSLSLLSLLNVTMDSIWERIKVYSTWKDFMFLPQSNFFPCFVYVLDIWGK